ncbi:alpha/beta hydrolase [Runella sp. SP2]|uniref:alpha/beta hydrolase n=1 Tax=Runella sp. SP2 TaxID=2268026 RepID=UPI000F07982A|nr:alpha/beta hydrolase-fold protein [Runella sp. SP2]AYQ31692.1 alpha/beta hydrolase [Runella sp. SP2]
MYRYLALLSLVGAVLIGKAQNQSLQLSGGKITRFENFRSRFVAERTVDVWTPSDYTPTQKYAVLYMHDGQMLFDSLSTWNRQEWGVDETLEKLSQTHPEFKNCLVVGIWNSGKGRHPDYFPQRPYELLTHTQKQFVTEQLQKIGRTTDAFVPNSDNYLRFIVEELKPFIDSTFSTFPNPENTLIAGSSMGGLISMYAFCEYPDVFGRVACLSTHWPGIFSLENNPIPDAFVKYLETNLPPPQKGRKIYFDFGTATLDALYEPTQRRVDALLKAKKYKAEHWKTLKFEGADHSEKAWKERLAVPFTFLLQK